jgi:hypothetical protein
MSRFPDTEPQIAKLALLICEGLQQAAGDLPAAPVPAAELQARLDAYNKALTATLNAETAFRGQHAVKDEALSSLVDGMKADLKYAEVTFRDQPEKLSQLGWGPRRDASALDIPGETRDIKIVTEGDTWLVLTWNPPVDGGEVQAYKIQRRKRDAGSWEEVGSSVDTKEMLSNQPRGVEMDYRVIAVNKAGEGQPSATVTVVL